MVSKFFLSALLMGWASVAVHAEPAGRVVEQKLLDITLKNGGGGEIRTFTEIEPGHAILNRITITGNGLGQKINQNYTPTDLTDMRSNHRPRTIVSIRGMNALTFLAGDDFAMEKGGTIEVGYLASPNKRKFVTVKMQYDNLLDRWWMVYPGDAKNKGPIRLHGLEMDVRTAPVVGPVGMKSVKGVDEFDRKFEIQAQ